MCLWFRHKPEIETELDPRSGAKDITVPVPGAFADPDGASATYTTSYPSLHETDQPISPPQPLAVPIEPVLITNEKPDHNSLLRKLTGTSHKSAATPAHSPPHSPPLPQQSGKRPQSGASTQFSTYSAHSYPNSPQPSPQWTKATTQVPTNHQSPDPGEENKSQSGMSQRFRNASPDPIPVHAAYIPSDQLSIGAKLSPGLSSSISTTPTTNGPRSGSASYSQTASPTSGYNPWKRDSSGTMPRNTTPSYSNAVSPIEGRLPFGKENGDSHPPNRLPMGFTMQTSQHNSPGIGIEMSTQPSAAVSTPPQTPPWEKRSLPKIVTVPAVNGQIADQGQQQDEEKDKRERHRLSLHMPSIKSKKKKEPPPILTAADREKSPQSAQSVEQWPGKM